MFVILGLRFRFNSLLLLLQTTTVSQQCRGIFCPINSSPYGPGCSNLRVQEMDDAFVGSKHVWEKQGTIQKGERVPSPSFVRPSSARLQFYVRALPIIFFCHASPRSIGTERFDLNLQGATSNPRRSYSFVLLTNC